MQPTEVNDVVDDRPVPAGRGVSSRASDAHEGPQTGGDDLQMQYLVSVIADTPDPTATASEMAAIDAFNDQLQTEGHWVFAGGLGPTDTATVVDNRGEEAMFSDGPFLESKEYLAGFWILEAPDLDVALKLAAEGSKACNRKIEVRPFL
jgi:hypothetical protein